MWGHSKYTHRLGLAVPEGALRRHHKFVAEPPIEDVAEEEHAAVHVEPTVVVDDLLANDVGHRSSFRISTDVFHPVEILEDAISEGKVLLSDIIFCY